MTVTWATVMRVTAQSLEDCSSESFLWADYHLSLLCSRLDQRSLLPIIEKEAVQKYQ